MMHQLTGKKNKVVLYIIFLLLLSTTSEKFSAKQKVHNLKIDKINVNGLSNSQNLVILSELNNILYQSIFFIGKEEIDKIISKHNIIEEYSIEKIYPSRLNINIKPTKLVAKISDNNELLIGANGKLIYSKDSEQMLPNMFGEFKSKEFLKFKEDIDRSKFNFADFRTIYFFPSKRWDILTKDNILIKLPQNDLFQSLSLAYKVIDNDQFKDKDIIDLRVKNNLIVK
jgi:cell division protein FtsQ